VSGGDAAESPAPCWRRTLFLVCTRSGIGRRHESGAPNYVTARWPVGRHSLLRSIVPPRPALGRCAAASLRSARAGAAGAWVAAQANAGPPGREEDRMDSVNLIARLTKAPGLDPTAPFECPLSGRGSV
jgi:hypothetical protein